MPTPAQHAAAQTVVTYRQGHDRATFLLDKIDSLEADKRAAATRQTIRDLCIEHAELMASIRGKHPRRPYVEQVHQTGFGVDRKTAERMEW